MIAALLAAGIVPIPSAAGSLVVRALAPAVVLQRYAASLAKLREPRVLTFDYTLDQTGPRTLAQTHRVYRSGANERDELLTIDGKRLSPPKVRIFAGRRNRYSVSALAPCIADYTFQFVGPRKNVRHSDYVFKLLPKIARSFSVTEVTIDGVRFLPSSLAFETRSSAGSGSVVFGINSTWWVPYTALARASVAQTTASEKLTFYTYRFPPALPSSTFDRGRPAPQFIPPGHLVPVSLPGERPAMPFAPAHAAYF